MVVIGVLYPNQAGTSFDLDYYRSKHLPLVRRLLAPMGMRSLTYFEPVATDPEFAYRLVAELRFDTMEATNAALAAHGPETQADIPNFTDSVPQIVIAEEVAA
jgi:uncharacterized protein (TIGR02118 family)